MALLAALFVLSFFLGSSEATWCVCAGTNTTALQAALDYACDKGADCAAINPNGLCFQSTDLLSRCSYAVNSYFQKNNQASEACNFAGTANITSNDPSLPGCRFPSDSAATPSPTATPAVPTVPTAYGPGGGGIPVDSQGFVRTCRPVVALTVAFVLLALAAA